MLAFDRACRELFRGWSSVATYNTLTDDRYHVHLTLDMRTLQAESMDRGALVARLFRQSDAWRAVAMVQKAREHATGLRFYGRKRRH